MIRRKARIQAAFNAAQAYDAQAHVQAQAAATLAGLAVDAGLDHGARVLEVGSGTGALATAFYARLRPGAYLATDISPAMLHRAATNLAGLDPPVRLAAMDAERPALRAAWAAAAASMAMASGASVAAPAAAPIASMAHQGFDAVVSSMALQWTADLEATLKGLWALVRPGGLLAVCVPGRGTFGEWQAAHQSCGLACGLNDFASAAELSAMLPPGAMIHTDLKQLAFARAVEFPRHLKAIGADVPRPGFRPLAPAGFRAVLAALDRAFPGGPRLTYHLLHALAVKPGQK